MIFQYFSRHIYLRTFQENPLNSSTFKPVRTPQSALESWLLNFRPQYHKVDGGGVLSWSEISFIKRTSLSLKHRTCENWLLKKQELLYFIKKQNKRNLKVSLTTITHLNHIWHIYECKPYLPNIFESVLNQPLGEM